jgi:hypothetical protein
MLIFGFFVVAAFGLADALAAAGFAAFGLAGALGFATAFGLGVDSTTAGADVGSGPNFTSGGSGTYGIGVVAAGSGTL